MRVLLPSRLHPAPPAVGLALWRECRLLLLLLLLQQIGSRKAPWLRVLLEAG